MVESATVNLGQLVPQERYKHLQKGRVKKNLEPKNHFRTIKILFFPDFPRLQVRVGGSDQIQKIPDFFLNPSLNNMLFYLDMNIKINIGEVDFIKYC